MASPANECVCVCLSELSGVFAITHCRQPPYAGTHHLQGSSSAAALQQCGRAESDLHDKMKIESACHCCKAVW